MSHNVPKRPNMSQNVPKRSKTSQNIQKCLIMFQNDPKHPYMFLNVQKCPKTSNDVRKCSKIWWSWLSYLGLFWVLFLSFFSAKLPLCEAQKHIFGKDDNLLTFLHKIWCWSWFFLSPKKMLTPNFLFDPNFF